MNTAILPAINKIISPKKGEKITGKRTGRLATCLIAINGWNINPKSVFAQIYVINIKKILLFMFYLS